MSIAILICSRNRPRRIGALVENLRSTAPFIPRYFAVTDRVSAEILSALGEPYWLTSPHISVHVRSQFLYEQTSEDVLFFGTDDSRFHPHWLAHAIPLLKEMSGVVSVNDLHSGEGTCAFMSRSYLDNFGGAADEVGTVTHLGYMHNYGEREAFEVAKMRGKFAYCEDSIVEHCKGELPDDETYQWGARYAHQDGLLFAERERLWSAG